MPLSCPRNPTGELDFGTGWRQSCETSYTSTWPTFVVRFPATAANNPRAWLRTSDSCGVSIAGVRSLSVSTGFVGSDMSRTFTPPSASRRLVGYISVVS